MFFFCCRLRLFSCDIHTPHWKIRWILNSHFYILCVFWETFVFFGYNGWKYFIFHLFEICLESLAFNRLFCWQLLPVWLLEKSFYLLFFGHAYFVMWCGAIFFDLFLRPMLCALKLLTKSFLWWKIFQFQLCFRFYKIRVLQFLLTFLFLVKFKYANRKIDDKLEKLRYNLQSPPFHCYLSFYLESRINSMRRKRRNQI